MHDKQTAIRDLKRILERECEAHEEYVALLAAEREAMKKFQADAVSELTLRRDVLGQTMAALRDQRVAICRLISGAEKTRVSEIAERYIGGADRAAIERSIERLKKLIESSRSASLEFNQSLNFSLNLINGSLAILMSATQNVVRSYTPYGVVRESFNPSQGSGGSSLARA